MSADRDGDPFARIEEAAVRQAAEERAARAAAAARARLVLGRDAASVFFATLALRLGVRADPGVGTMATDGRVLAYDPTFVCGLSADEVVGVVAHEVLHCAQLTLPDAGSETRHAGTKHVTWQRTRSCSPRGSCCLRAGWCPARGPTPTCRAGSRPTSTTPSSPSGPHHQPGGTTGPGRSPVPLTPADADR